MAEAPKSLKLHCPAKVNLALSVGAPLENGMHPIASLMCALQFGDELTIEKSPDPSHFDIQFCKLCEQDDQPMGIVDWPLEKDLAYRALKLLEDHVGKSLPVHVAVHKKIPAGAGLAGGSSNAAGLLMGVNRLYNLGFDTQTLATLANQLGSDVVFMVHAMQDQLDAAIVSGLGETIHPLKLKSPVDLVLIFPSFGCPTGAVYGAFDQLLMDNKQTSDLKRVEQLADRPSIQPSDPFNDLASAACKIQPELGKIQAQLSTDLQMPIQITGSGSTMYLICENHPSAQQIAQQINQFDHLKATATQTV